MIFKGSSNTIVWHTREFGNARSVCKTQRESSDVCHFLRCGQTDGFA